MPTDWRPKTLGLRKYIDAELARIDELKQIKQAETWQPPITTATPTESWLPVEIPPSDETPSFVSPRVSFPEPQQILPQPQLEIPQPLAPPPPPIDKFAKELDPLHPFKWEDDLPLWAKTINVIGKPFELIQEYLFDPLLAGIHLPFTAQLSPENERLANQQGIGSYFPGGIRHQAYEKLQYPMKWALEMLPWLVVPVIGTVGRAGTIAGTLAKAGKAGQVAGKALEMSPYGLMEKATAKIVGEVTGLIKLAQKKLPQKAIMNKELRMSQLASAQDELAKGGYGENGLRRFAAAFKGEAENVDFENIAQKLTQGQKNKMADLVLRSKNITDVFDRRQATSGWEKILKGILPVDSELEQLEKVFGPDLVQALIDKKPGNIINKISDIANAPRAVLSAVDFSGQGRQGAILVARHPKEALKTFLPMFKSFFKDENAKLVDDVIQARPNYNRLAKNTYFAPLPSENAFTPLLKMEESFMSKWIQTIPGLGWIVRASNRAFVTGLNDLRSRVGESTLTMWDKFAQKNADKIMELTQSGGWEKLTLKAQKELLTMSKVTELDEKWLGTLLNAASGRGSLPKALQGASPLFNAMMFSPRLFISRIQFPMLWMPGVNPSPLARKEAARMLVQFLGTGTAILGMAHVLGSKIETNPQSADFGKIRIGNTRLDIWSGYTQWARFVTQLTTATRKTQYGNFTELNRLDVIERFLQSKYSPAMGLINDLLRGEGYSGEEVNITDIDKKRMIATRLMPLFLQDMIDAIDQEGLVGGMVALPGLFGIGVVTYMSPAQKLKEQLAQEKYSMSWEEVGTKHGMAAQQDLERSDAKLLAEIQKEKEDYNKTITGKSDIGNVYRNQTSTIENEYQRRVALASQEYRDTGDGYIFKEKIMQIADNRRSQYDVLNADPQFSKIVARYNELPTPNDLKRMSPQDLARKEYMRMLYGKDMYDQYDNYRFDMVDDIKDFFVQTFGQDMLDYVETYQGIKEQNMTPEYKMFKQAQKVLKPYWAVEDEVIKVRGEPKTKYQLKVVSAMVSRIRKRMRAENPELDAVYRQFYSQSKI